MPPKKKSEKPRVIEFLYEQYKRGEIPDGLVTNDRVADAIKATKADLSVANPANFLKDIIRGKGANRIWPDALKSDRVSARQRYGSKRVFQFVPYEEGQDRPFPDYFEIDESTKTHQVQAASIPFAARQLGRSEESWLTQIVVNLRLIESQLSIFSPYRDRVRDVTHLQMGMKTQPEIDAVFLASYGASGKLSSETSLHVLVTCEAKQFRQRILENQIREQVGKAMEITDKIKNPQIQAVKPMAIQVVEHEFVDGKEKAIFIVEFEQIPRADFASDQGESEKMDRLLSMKLKAISKAIYRITPPIAGLNSQ